MQSYMSAINGFYRDHGVEHVAQGDLIAKIKKKGQAASQKEKDLPPGAQPRIAALQPYFDAARAGYSGRRGLPTAITHGEPTALWTPDTVTAWLQRVAQEMGEQPPDGFPWTSHSLRSKGIAIAAYAFGVVLQKIKHFGGWVVLSSVVLGYIDPTALPCAASWQFFGWFTPWWGQHPTAACPPMGGMMTNAAPP
eukprot:jgi/Tetstr1/428431/TSEL_018445.t1